jgi:hypothetical protein
MPLNHRLITAFIVLLLSANASGQPANTLDLLGTSTASGKIFRLQGSVGDGSSGVPVAGGFDMDKDLSNDFAMASFRAGPGGVDNAGTVYLVFGNDQVAGQIDTAASNSRVLTINGVQPSEHAGSELWMADVTGDTFGDLIICRQDYSPPGRLGGGALTLIPGQPMLRTMAANNEVLDLGAPPEGLQIVNIFGANAGSRLCIWARTGDITGDGTDDFVIGADREASNAESDSGAVYLIRGGSYLETSQTIDLADFGTVIPGNVARVRPLVDSVNFHFGATVQVADLDGNGKAEVMVAAALSRAGAALGPVGGFGEGSGGERDGTLYIAWDDNFDNDWIPAPDTSLDFIIDAGAGSYSRINGFDFVNDTFGEEILGGLDYDDDGNADLFVGDLTADGWGAVTRNNAGTGHVIYNATNLKNLDFDLSDASLPAGFSMSTFIGRVAGAIGGDTAMHGDFNGDGIADLAFSSPHDNPFGRFNAGTIHIMFGQTGGWPAVIDLAPANFPSPAVINILEIYGANGGGTGDSGDTLSYSGAFGDMNKDGVTDIITNEMLGNGNLPSAIDVGNLLLIDVRRILDTIFGDSFE